MLINVLILKWMTCLLHLKEFPPSLVILSLKFWYSGSLIEGPAETNPLVLMNKKQGRLEVLFSQLKSFKWLWRYSNSETRLWKDVASSAHCLNHSFHISMEEIKDKIK